MRIKGILFLGLILILTFVNMSLSLKASNKKIKNQDPLLQHSFFDVSHAKNDPKMKGPMNHQNFVPHQNKRKTNKK